MQNTAEIQKKTLGFNVPDINPHKRMGRLVYMARVSQGKSREELARELNVSRIAVRFWEIGERSIDGVMLGRLAEALNQDVNLFWS